MNLGEPIAPVVPHDWQLGLPEPASQAMAQMADLHRLFVYLACAALAMLLAALGWIVVRYDRRLHPKPDRGKDDALAMTGFVGAMVVVLVLAAVPALRLTAFAADGAKPDIVIEAVGKVGSWSYAYPGEGDFRFESTRLDAKAAARYRQPAMMAVNNPLVVPVGRTVEILATSVDIVHVWSVPALGSGGDAIPGRVNRFRFRADRPGIYYGLCSQDCGGAGTMTPIAVKAVGEEEYRGWLAWAKRSFAGEDAVR